MGNVSFKTNILLKNIIGKDLITDDNIAVLELVKNAYDAGSPVVEIVFENIKQESSKDLKSKLLICDKGSGMDEDSIMNKWLNIAYSEKKGQSFMNGRRQAGNKGVGRFSCDRLGKELVLYTKTRESKCFSIHIDWSVFENEEAQDFQIQDVVFDLQEISVDRILALTGWNHFEHGTILEICDLREIWLPNKIQRLRRDLEKFINPNQAYLADGFRIEVKAGDYLDFDAEQTSEISKVNGLIENKVFDRLNFKTTSITSQISETGDFLDTTLSDRGRDIFVLRERNPYQCLKNVKISVYYLNRYAKSYFAKQTGFSSVDFGSIFLFVNGFRVPPYGDQGDDWLGIERRKSSGYRRYLSTREVIGRIEITDESDNFRIITSRSGIVHNDAFDELSREGKPYGFFYKTFRRLERFVVEGIKWDKSIGSGDDENSEFDNLSRNTRVLSVVRKIIDLKDSEIVSMSINEDFIEETIQSQVSHTKDEIADVVRKLSELSKDSDPSILDSYVHEVSTNSVQLKHFLNVVSRFGTEEQINKIHSVQESIKSSEDIIIRLRNDIDEYLIQKKEAEAKAERLKAELEIEQERNIYLTKSTREMSEDAKGMVHNIKIISKNIKATVANLFEDLQNGTCNADQIKRTIGLIAFENEKALKISNLITRANFNAERKDQMIDIIGYIRDYISIYKDLFEKEKLTFEIAGESVVYVRKVSVLDIAIIFDNLISNASKAGATKFSIKFEKVGNDHLDIIVSDDGKGIDPRFEAYPARIFELGVTTTDGSGIGLYTVREALAKMRGCISYYGKGDNGSGAVFKITL